MRKGALAALGEFHEIFPAIGIVFRLPHHAGHFFIIHVAVESAHAMSFDEGDHVIFEAGKVVRRGRHKKTLINSALYDFWWRCTRGGAIYQSAAMSIQQSALSSQHSARNFSLGHEQ